MDDSQARKFQKDLNAGLVALVLLGVLDKSSEDLYGYEIAKRLQKANEGEALFKEGTVYPVLRALAAAGLLTSRVVPSYAGPARRYYRITEEGRAVLHQWSAIWRQTRSFVDLFIEGTDVMNAPRSIDEYLKQLRQALQGADPALVQDALYDAEEYLRAEVAAHPGKSEADVLELIASTYGAPRGSRHRLPRHGSEGARRAAHPLAARRAPTPRRCARFFGVYLDPRTYTSLFYMLLALATGIVYFTFVVMGLSLSLGFAVLIIGIPFFLAFIGIARVIALGEGRLLEAVTGERMPRRPVHPGPAAHWWDRIIGMLKDVRTWTTLAYLGADAAAGDPLLHRRRHFHLASWSASSAPRCSGRRSSSAWVSPEYHLSVGPDLDVLARAPGPGCDRAVRQRHPHRYAADAPGAGHRARPCAHGEVPAGRAVRLRARRHAARYTAPHAAICPGDIERERPGWRLPGSPFGAMRPRRPRTAASPAAMATCVPRSAGP